MSVLEQDLNKIVELFKYREQVKDKTILITGSTGLIGFLLLNVLIKLNLEGMNINVILPVRNKSRLDVFLNNKNLKIIETDLMHDLDINSKIDFIIHAASPTQSSDLFFKPLETLDFIYTSTKALLNLAVKKSVSSFVFLSSIEVYGICESDKFSINESDYGYNDHLTPRSSYIIGKKVAESLCKYYSIEKHLNTKVARLTQTFGPGVSHNDNRVFIQFAHSIINKENIVLHTAGNSSKPYIYTVDAINAIFDILFLGKSGEVYNVSNDDTKIDIRTLAQTLLDKYNYGGSIQFKHNSEFYPPESHLDLNTEKLKSLGWKPLYMLNEMFERLIKFMTGE